MWKLFPYGTRHVLITKKSKRGIEEALYLFRPSRESLSQSFFFTFFFTPLIWQAKITQEMKIFPRPANHNETRTTEIVNQRNNEIGDAVKQLSVKNEISDCKIWRPVSKCFWKFSMAMIKFVGLWIGK